MSIWLYTLIIILFLILIFTIIKIHLMKKDIRQIGESVNRILKSDTNTLLTISSSDKELKKLGSTLNKELRKLRTLKLEYENGNQEFRNLITNISHDMRTPLTAIKGYMDLIKQNRDKENKNGKENDKYGSKENDEYNDKENEYLRIIDNKTNELIDLTNQLFDFSKAVDIGIKMEKENNCINNIIEEVLASYYSAFREKSITPIINICKEKVYRNIDIKTITRVFENILSNVIKYSNGDFEVILENNGTIIFSNKARELDATTVRKIFDRYYTVQDAKRSTGLGLSIAKQLIELNDGNINAKYINGYLIIKIEFKDNGMFE